MKNICIDLGASSTRVTGENGIIHELPNYLIFKDRTDVVDLDTARDAEDKLNDFLGNLDVVVEKTTGAPCKAFPARALVGELATRCSATVNRPSVMMNKSRQNINLFNILVAAMQQCYTYGYDGSPITLYIAFPPLEVTKDVKDEINQSLVGTYAAKIDKLDLNLTLNIGEVKVFPEAYMALAAFFFNFPSCTLRKEIEEKYGKGHIMGLDIGASTTDIAVALNRKLLEKSGQTIKTGCNVIEMDIANSIRSKYGYDPTHEDLTTAICEGRLPMGNGYVDVSDMLRRAKQEFARTIVAELQNYFRLVNIPLQSIRAIMVCGGGSLPSGYFENEQFVQTCACVGDFITKELNNVVENIDVITMEDPRTANTRGLFVRMMMEKAAAEAQAKKAAETQATAAEAAVANATI